jgi:hypothetical protein
MKDVQIGEAVDIEGFDRGVVRRTENGDVVFEGERNRGYFSNINDLKVTRMIESTASKGQQEIPQDTSSGASDHQNHYKAAARQPIEFMQELMSPEAFDGFLLGNILKYRLRAGFKDDTEKDLEKAAQYAHWRELAKKGIMIDPERDVVPEGFTYEVV